MTPYILTFTQPSLAELQLRFYYYSGGENLISVQILLFKTLLGKALRTVLPIDLFELPAVKSIWGSKANRCGSSAQRAGREDCQREGVQWVHSE